MSNINDSRNAHPTAIKTITIERGISRMGFSWTIVPFYRYVKVIIGTDQGTEILGLARDIHQFGKIAAMMETRFQGSEWFIARATSTVVTLDRVRQEWERISQITTQQIIDGITNTEEELIEAGLVDDAGRRQVSQDRREWQAWDAKRHSFFGHLITDLVSSWEQQADLTDPW